MLRSRPTCSSAVSRGRVSWEPAVMSTCVNNAGVDRESWLMHRLLDVRTHRWPNVHDRLRPRVADGNEGLRRHGCAANWLGQCSPEREQDTSQLHRFYKKPKQDATPP